MGGRVLSRADGRIKMRRYLLCIAHGRDSKWEAFCLDYDLAVQGNSFEEVRGRLHHAIEAYVHAAMAEPDPVSRRELLHRAVPLRTRLLWRFRVALWALLSREREHESTFGFPVSCPA